MKYDGKYYLGLDIGTDSVGYAVTDDKYNLLKFHGEPAWGVTIFDGASLCDERRSFRIARRRLDRRKQRVELLQELFSKEIAKVDPRFFIRLQESKLYREDVEDKYVLFNDAEFTDQDYYSKYPTIHHLILDLMNSDESFDVRLVYLACAWLVSHRGHFLSNISVDNLAEIKDVTYAYDAFMLFFDENGFERPWINGNAAEIGELLKSKCSVSKKGNELAELLYGTKKVSKDASEFFPFNRAAIVKLLAGSTVKLKELFLNDAYAEIGSVSLGMDDDALGEIAGNIGDDFALIEAMRPLYDWAVLADSIGEAQCISEAKVQSYEQHKADLAFLKKFIRKHCSKAQYNAVFRDLDKNNYAAYVYHTDESDNSKFKRKSLEDFSKYILSVVKDIVPDENDRDGYDDMCLRLESRSFMPKQKNTDNRVIPCQLYHYELKRILAKAELYLPFLAEESDGLTTSQKIESIFTFKIPYFVGPLNSNSDFAWLDRRAGKIYPWNFEDMVDLDASEEKFITRMTNTCTYLPGETVLPKDSLAYHRFMVLNEINSLRINGERISVDLKQSIYNDLFMNVKKVTRKKLCEYLISNGVIGKGDENLITGIDVDIKSNLSSQIAFKQLITKGIITNEDVEAIIERASYAEDKSRLRRWIEKKYPHISEEDIKYICRIKIKDFGRLSGKFLREIEGVKKDSGEVFTIISALWNTQDNLMELLSDRYTFAEEIENFRQEYYKENAVTLEKRLDEMYVSNAVKRPIYRTLAIIKDIQKAFGKPAKIFVETTRGGSPDQKGKRTMSRKQQILNLYEKCKDEDVRILRKQLEDMGEYADNKLQGDKLFLYYMQLGKCMYSGEPIALEKLGSKLYDIDHIYPQAFVKDDSILNNKVLVLSEKNGEKSDNYPIKEDIRHKMEGYWKFLKNSGLITDEKYKRLVRNTPFTDTEKLGFINRQLTETSQSTKAVAEILKTRFPSADVVYCKARLASEFRQEFELLKSRTFNDLHHAKDAYINIVTGNVYDMKFSKKWFIPSQKYSMKTKTLFTHPLVCNGVTVWDGGDMLAKVKKTVAKNNAHFTKYAYFKTGGLFNQMPVSAEEGLVPLKKGMDTAKYGGYNKSGAMFYIPVRYKQGKKATVIIMSVEMQCGNRFLEDSAFAEEYSFKRLQSILEKPVESVEFPMGMRPWKVNTMLELDGFRICISGIGSGGKTLVAQPIMQFSEDLFWNNYMKRIEHFVDKCTANKNYVYDVQYDKVNYDDNLKLYDIYIEKYEETVFAKRVNPPVDILKEGRSAFASLDIEKQAKALLNIHQTFGRISGGCDFSLIGGKEKAAATVSFSATVSNWKKKYEVVRIVDSSVSGLWTKKSENLLELL